MQRPAWGPEASTKKVRVVYRIRTHDERQEATTTRTMEHAEYINWALDAYGNGYELVRAEQIPEGES